MRALLLCVFVTAYKAPKSLVKRMCTRGLSIQFAQWWGGGVHQGTVGGHNLEDD
jgi:hypothetical protein